MSAIIMCYERLATLTNKKTFIQAEVTSEQAVTEMKIFHLQIDDSDHIININHK